jgi:hypothetical protein
LSADSAPQVTVVVASNGTAGAVARCLASLDAQREGVEVIVCQPAAPEQALVERFPGVRWHHRADALVPELWRDGIRLARGELVALTISPMLVAGDWIATLRDVLEEWDAVGGAVEPAPGLGLADSAEHLTRYARDMLPFERQESLELAGDNAGYRRALLAEVASSWENGFWEPDVHRALAARGARLVHDPALVVRMGPSAGAGAFVRQRVAHGRAFGRARGAGAGTAANLARVAAAAVVPLVLVLRTTREVLARGRGRRRLALALPFLLLFDVAWACGEALGHLDALRGR